ncbi:MAG: ATP-binding protein [Bacteroidales bacterium]|nr:ATP-binding protein [Bacteroidales bacterium]
MAVNGVRWSLFGKFAIGISLTVIVFGLLNAIIVRNSVSNSLNEEFEKRGYFITRALAEQSVSFILANDPAGLNMLINDLMAIDPSIQYAIVLDGRGEVVAHSFRERVPAGLLQLNQPQDDDVPGIITVRDQQDARVLIRDFSLAAISSGMGSVRVGILEHEIRDQVKAVTGSLLLMVAVFLILGLFAALFFSYTIATPLQLLSRQSATMDLINIEVGLKALRKTTQKPFYRLRRLFGLKDEIDLLYENYTDMLRRLGKAYHDLNMIQQSLLQSEKLAAIGTLTAGVAHEINNPLAGISIGLRRLKKEPENIKQVKEYSELMQEALSRIEKVVDDLLTFSRKDDEVYEEVELTEVIKKAIKLAKYRVKSEKIQIVLDKKAEEVNVHASPNRLEQVFLNIIINSIDAIMEKMEKQPRLEGQIRVVVSEMNDMAHVVFSDNGPGIAEDIKDKIFDPFFTTKGVGKGTGLGLSVSYEIIRGHGGTILAESEPGTGSRIIITLPKNEQL